MLPLSGSLFQPGSRRRDRSRPYRPFAYTLSSSPWSLRTDPETTVAYSRMGRKDLLSIHAGTVEPITPIGLIDGTGAEIEVAQGAVLGDVFAVGPKVCADCVVRVGKVH